jgi:DNA-binding NtrC family response regulator
MTGQFRTDLLFRLRRFHLEVPPLRERGDDWILLVEHNLERLRKRYGVAKRFSPASLARLERYRWPGNIRQLISVVTTGYAMAEGDTIEPRDFVPLLEEACAAAEPAEALYDRVVRDGEDFWQTVYEPFMARDLNRREVRNLIARGLAETQGNYRKLLALFRLPDADYQRFMDFLRHQNLKPQS